MSNIKLYFVSSSDLDRAVAEIKMPKQQVQIYRALADLGTPTRGCDVIAHAVKNFGLETRQDYQVLAAWYFSEKRRPACVTIGKPVEPPQIEDMTDVEAAPSIEKKSKRA
jgi:hypothetical protein